MKFVCDQCQTKYSIADEKVRNKVLRIRCKNCGNVVIVKEGSHAPDKAHHKKSDGKEGSGKESSILDRAFDGAIAKLPTGAGGKPAMSAIKGGGGGHQLAEVASDDEFEPDQTQIAAPALRTDPTQMDDEWYLAFEGHQFGPMSFAELCSRVKRGEARGSSGDDAYVWRDGFDDWVEVNKLPELRPYVPPPPPPSKSGLFRLSSLDRGPAAAPPPPVTTAPPPDRLRGSYPSLGAMMATQPPPASASGAGDGMVATPNLPMMTPMPPGMAGYGEGMGGQRAPLSIWIKIAVVGGIASTLMGMVLILYVLVSDRPRQPNVIVQQPLANAGSQHSGASSDPDREVAIDFPAEEIEQVRPERAIAHRGARGAKPPANGKAAAVAPKENLTDEQRRLMALYGSGGDESAPDITVGGRRGGGARSDGPARRITPNEVANVQKRNRASLTMCYERALKRDQTLTEAKVDIEVGIGDSGIVKSVKVQGTNNSELTECLQRSVKRWAFPAIGAQDFIFTINFRGS